MTSRSTSLTLAVLACMGAAGTAVAASSQDATTPGATHAIIVVGHMPQAGLPMEPTVSIALPDELGSIRIFLHADSEMIDMIRPHPADDLAMQDVPWLSHLNDWGEYIIAEKALLLPQTAEAAGRLSPVAHASVQPDSGCGASQARLGDGGQAGLRIAARFGGSNVEHPQIMILA